MNLDFAPLIQRYLPLVTTLLFSTLIVVTYRYLIIIRPSRTHTINPIPRQLGLACLVLSAIVAIVLALPINQSEKGQLLNLLGILITAAIALSSTTFVGNAMAGMMLKSIKNVKVGDFLKVDGHFGKVVMQGFLHTEIQTDDSDLTTFPNLFLINNPVKVVKSSGTVLKAEVSLGYSVPWKKAEASLKKAATDAGLRDPFVQISKLGDFSVTYTAAGFLDEVKYILSKRSRLRSAMLDSLHAENIEVVSPTFMNQKQIKDSQSFIPELMKHGHTVEQLPEDQMFDVADEAANLEAVKDRLTKVKKELKDLEMALKEDESEKIQEELKHRQANLIKEEANLKKLLKDQQK